MATLVGLVLELVEASWKLSVEFLPLLYLGFLGYALAEDQENSLLATAVRSQESYTLHYGLYIVAGLVVGGLSVSVLGGMEGLLSGGAVALTACIYGYMKEGVPEMEELELESWTEGIELLWLIVPLLAVAGLVTGDPLVKSVVALAFYSAVFWEV
ncbi:MAG: hypothetical protein SVS85_02820 [Candidatus Nanohaloarchaea archaeon]|nr:hypothetical protein [Candidatus Nanohaloarchaea archaeon]